MQKMNAYETAEYLGISYGRVLYLARHKELPHAKLGAMYVFDKKVIDSHFETRMMESVQQAKEEDKYPNLRAIGGFR